MRLGSWELRESFPVAGGGLDALAADPATGRDVRLWIGAPGRPVGGDPAEALAALRLRLAKAYHAALPRPIGEAVVDGRPVLVVTAYEGRLLDDVLASSRPESPLALDWVRGVAAALVKAHRAGLVHGALDARSILITAAEGRPLLLHTGFGPFLDERPRPAPEDRTAPGAPAPEGSESGDVYGLSRVLVRALTGAEPVGGDPTPEDFPPELPEGLRRLLARALRRDLAGRLARAEELAGDLGVIRSSWDSMAEPPQAPLGLRLPGGPAARWVLAGLAVAAIAWLASTRGCG